MWHYSVNVSPPRIQTNAGVDHENIVAGFYQLRITRLPSRAEAKALARKLTGKMAVTAPTVGR